MNRCEGSKTPGNWTGFECVLDDGHGGGCQPYVPPTVDEWRALQAEMAGMRGFFGLAGGEDEAAKLVADRDRLQAELDALRAVVESGASTAAHVVDLLAKVKRGDYRWPDGVAWVVGECHRLLTGGEPDGVYVRKAGVGT